MIKTISLGRKPDKERTDMINHAICTEIRFDYDIGFFEHVPFACLALVATAVEEKRILLNDPDLIHSEITAMQHQMQEMNSKLQDQQNKLLAQERLIAEIQTKTQTGNINLLCILAIEMRHC